VRPPLFTAPRRQVIWGVSRIIDVIAASPGGVLVIAVSGCFRYAKDALDERIALTLPIESGTCGAPYWRCIAQESGSRPLSNKDNGSWHIIWR
jgi:hypothetical protein